MYETYNPEYDLYNFYLAKKSDKKMLEKLGVQKFPAIVVVDKNNNFLFKREANLMDDSYLFDNYTNVNTLIKEAKNTLEINTLFADKKQTREKILAAFTKINKIKTNISYATADTATVATPVMEAVPAPPKGDMQKEEEEQKEEEVEDVTETAVDTAQTVDYYNENKANVNDVYAKLNVTRADLDKKFKTLYNYYLNLKQPDQEFINLLVQNINDKGYAAQLFGQMNYDYTQETEDALAYFFKFKKQLLQDKINEKEPYLEDADYNQIYTVKESVFTALSKSNSALFDAKSKHNYYNQILEMSNYNPTHALTYFDYLKNYESENVQKRIEIADKIIDSQKKSGKSPIEFLDEFFSKTSYQTTNDWNTYKYDFANMYNTIAWDTYENKDVVNYNKAVTWTEFSNKVVNDNAYFLDTLANLYFETGKKQEAIIIQTKAVEKAKKEGIDFKDFEDNLNRMK
jgi:hypothetical protein